MPTCLIKTMLKINTALLFYYASTEFIFRITFGKAILKFLFFFNSKSIPPLAFTELIAGGGVKALHSKKKSASYVKAKS